MPKFILLLVLFQTTLSFSQISQNKEQRQAILDATKKGVYDGNIGVINSYAPKSNFVIITEQRDINSNFANVFFDFGQESGFFDIDYIVDEDGVKFQLFSVVDALNYMKKLGWHLVETNGYGWLQFYITKYLFENKGDAVVPIIKE